MVGAAEAAASRRRTRSKVRTEGWIPMQQFMHIKVNEVDECKRKSAIDYGADPAQIYYFIFYYTFT